MANKFAHHLGIIDFPLQNRPEKLQSEQKQYQKLSQFTG